MEGEREHPFASEPSHCDVEQCTTWEEVENLLLSRGVPETQLPSWEALWRWDQLKAELRTTTTNQALDHTTLKRRLNSFSLRVIGTKETYECLVPEREGCSGITCGKFVCRQDRLRTHMLSQHLGVRLYQCQGRCGTNGW